MNRHLNKIYLRSPIVLQNILVSIYGFLLIRDRYGKERANFERELDITESYSNEEMEEYQRQKFIEVAREAICHVPFYKDWANNNSFSEHDIRCLSDINRFPIIEKSDIRNNPEYFISRKVKKKDLIALSTSGSTGSPIKIFCDRSTRTKHYSFFSRLRSWYGVGKRGRRITFFGRIVASEKQRKPPFWRYDLAQNNLLMSSHHMSESNLPFYYEKLKSFKPKEIFGYPSSIYRLARYIVESDKDRYIPNVVITTAETLLPYQRKVIEEAFLCSVVDQYGCTEMAFFASQCRYGVMHFHPEHSIIEIVDANSNPLPNGEPGEVVATSLINKVMPLIRYRVGDSLSLVDRDLKCHSSFPVIGHLEGRTDDLIFTKDGKAIGRLSPIFRSDKNIKLSQVIQRENGDIDIFVVPNSSYSNKNRNMIYEEAKERIGSIMVINIIEVEDIGKESNGKFRPVKCFFRPEC